MGPYVRRAVLPTTCIVEGKGCVDEPVFGISLQRPIPTVSLRGKSPYAHSALSMIYRQRHSRTLPSLAGYRCGLASALGRISCDGSTYTVGSTPFPCRMIGDDIRGRCPVPQGLAADALDRMGPHMRLLANPIREPFTNTPSCSPTPSRSAS